MYLNFSRNRLTNDGKNTFENIIKFKKLKYNRKN